MQPHQVIFDIYLKKKKKKKRVCPLLYKTFMLRQLITDNFEQKLGSAPVYLPQVLIIYFLFRWGKVH